MNYRIDWTEEAEGGPAAVWIAAEDRAVAIAAHFLGVPPPKDVMYPLPGTLK